MNSLGRSSIQALTWSLIAIGLLGAGLLSTVPASAADKYLERVETGSTSATAKSSRKKNKKGSKKTVGKNAQKTTGKKLISGSEEKSHVTRDMVFTGTDINGKYLSPGESVATVETEKNLNQLIGLRKDFRDRLAVERERLKTADNSVSTTSSSSPEGK